MTEESAPKSNRNLYLVGFVVLVVFAGSFFLPVKDWVNALSDWIAGLGYWGPVVYIVFYVLATLLLLPGAALTPLAGFLFGLGWGSLWAIIGSNIGANLAFLIGRYFARSAVEKRVSENEKFSAIDEAVGNEGWKIVGLTRMSPVFPFTLLNYAYSLTSVKWIHFALASFVGMAPGTVMYVYFGSLGKLAAEADETSTGKIILMIVGLIATVLVTVFVTKLAKKALAEKTNLEE
ncbi:MAG: TVP38/TMEM64 family protein [Verrucomicrobiales bacterium]|nr:TVP38/TMEM64 family protein [Verrucomicrobiales bacterium]